MLKHLSGASVPLGLRGPVLIDQLGLPRYWAAVWSATSAAQLADSTHVKRLRYIENLYQHADQLLGESSLDSALGTLHDEALAEILESWFVSLRNQPDATAIDEKTGPSKSNDGVSRVGKTSSCHVNYVCGIPYTTGASLSCTGSGKN